jgi:hypothetical protein
MALAEAGGGAWCRRGVGGGSRAMRAPTWYPCEVHPAACRYCGTCVVLPEPVSPTSTTVACVSTRYSSWRS